MVIALTLAVGLARPESYFNQVMMGFIAIRFALLDDINMAIFLDWFASHNTLVIQSLAAVVALLIVFLIFRLLFAAEAAADGVSAKNVTYAQLEEKLNKLLEQQSQMKVSINAATDGAGMGEVLGDEALAALSGDPATAAAAATDGATAAPAGGVSAEQAAELSRLRAEISTLKDSLKRKENEIIDAKDQAQKSVNTAQQDAKLNDLSSKITDYETEIDALKNRLSDYEIIAEDIADLQQYKKENIDLKNQLAKQSTQTAPVTVDEVVEEKKSDVDDLLPETTEEVAAAPAEMPEEPVAEQPVEEAAAASAEEEEEAVAAAPAEEPHVPNDIFAAANEMMNESVPDSVVEDELMPEATATGDLDNDEAREVSKDVKKEEKILLDEFEKHFAKDDD